MKNILKNYISLIKHYKKEFSILYIVLFLAWSMMSIQPMFFKWFTDAIVNQNWNILFQLLIFLGAFELSYGLIDTGAWRVVSLLKIYITRDIRLKVFKKLQELDMSYHISRSTGSTLSILKRGDKSVDAAFLIFHMFMGGTIISFIISFIILININIFIALSVFIFAILFIFIIKYMLNYNFKWRRAFHDSEDEVTSKICDNLMNMTTVKHFAKEKWEAERVSSLFKPWTYNYVTYDKTFRVIDLAAGIIKALNLTTALILGYYYFTNGLITAGSFVLLFSVINQLNNHLHYFVYNYREFNKSLVDVEKYLNILDEKPLVKNPKDSIDIKKLESKIEFKDVSFNYPENTNNVFEKLNFKINSNEKVALVGKSGAGKTTLTTLLLRFYDVVSGGIYIDDTNIKKFKKEDLRLLFSIVPQDPIMFNDTIKYNICYGKPNASKEEIIQACKTANIYDFIETLPEKFETQVGERGIKLSGGQKQRLAIARVVLNDPQIIIFDEATSQLDSESEKKIQDSFWKIAKEKTTIIIAHRLSTVIKADRIVVFNNGRIIESGTHEELLKLNGEYCNLWKIQSAKESTI